MATFVGTVCQPSGRNRPTRTQDSKLRVVILSVPMWKSSCSFSRRKVNIARFRICHIRLTQGALLDGEKLHVCPRCDALPNIARLKIECQYHGGSPVLRTCNIHGDLRDVARNDRCQIFKAFAFVNSIHTAIVI